jgi:hypothetical protein
MTIVVCLCSSTAQLLMVCMLMKENKENHFKLIKASHQNKNQRNKNETLITCAASLFYDSPPLFI